MQITKPWVLLIVAASIAIASMSMAGGERSERKVLNTPETAERGLPFSDAVLVGDTLYISGKLGLDREAMKPPEDPQEEVRLIMEEIGKSLALAGMTMDNIVNVTVFCSDVSLYGDFNAVYREYFNDGFPARAFVGSGPLLFDANFEVQAIAVR